MDTLHLVAPGYREAAHLIPRFEYSAEAIPDIRQQLLQAYAQCYGPPETITKEEMMIAGLDGAPQVRALLYRPTVVSKPIPALLHIHGGGWIGGTADMLASFCSNIANRHGVLVLSVDYRLAPETPFPGPLDDVYACLAWLHKEANALGIDADRIAVLGDSAGGNLAAGVALRARDDGTYPICGQLLIYPALDDRTGGPEDRNDNPYAGEFVITREYMRALWGARVAQSDISEKLQTYFAPSRCQELSSLPRTWIAVGSLDLFARENADYALRLGQAGVPVELHIYDGVFHGFDLIPGEVTNRFSAELHSAIDRLLDILPV